jgi:hypothetical protein
LVNGYDASDQVVRYGMEGMEILLKLTGTAAKHAAAFLYAVLQDQKRTRGKTTVTRMLRENKPLKFFQVPIGQLKEFARQARKYGLLYVAIRSKGNAAFADLMVMAQDAPKINRIMERLKLAAVDTGTAEIVRDQGDVVTNFTRRGQVSPSTSSLPSRDAYRQTPSPARSDEPLLLPAASDPVLITEPPKERLALPAPGRMYVNVKAELTRIRADIAKTEKGRMRGLKMPVAIKAASKAYRVRSR